MLLYMLYRTVDVLSYTNSLLNALGYADRILDPHSDCGSSTNRLRDWIRDEPHYRKPHSGHFRQDFACVLLEALPSFLKRRTNFLTGSLECVSDLLESMLEFIPNFTRFATFEADGITSALCDSF